MLIYNSKVGFSFASTPTSSRLPVMTCSGATPGGMTGRVIGIESTAREEMGEDGFGGGGGALFGISATVGGIAAGFGLAAGWGALTGAALASSLGFAWKLLQSCFLY